MGISSYMRVLGTLGVALLPLMVQARPVSFPDGWMAMQMHDGTQDSVMLTYSPSAFYAVGERTDYMREDKSWLHTASYNRLLKRWNGSDSQANIFLLGGVGAATKADSTKAAGTLGIEVDWETRRYYTAYENRIIASDNIDQSYTHKARVGIAPYIAGYNDINTWFMLQVDHTPTSHDNVVVTPLVRLFTTEVLGEIGISNKKDVMANLTVQF